MLIGRRPDGTIYGAFATQQKPDDFHPGLEEVEDTHPEYVAFKNRRVGRVHFDPVAEIHALKLRITELETKAQP